jgi:hypothetical protein
MWLMNIIIKCNSIHETPELELKNWKVFEVDSELWPGKTRHFVGYNITEREGRVSSAIEVFDKETMTGRTKSGRVYKLVGEPGYDPDADYVWGFFVVRNKLSEIVNVTQEMVIKDEEI